MRQALSRLPSHQGNRQDEQGAVVPGATVSNQRRKASRSASTDSEGTYYIQYLPVGTYSVEVEQAGFKKFVQQISSSPSIRRKP